MDVILYIVYLMLNIQWVQCHIHKGCDTMESVGVRHICDGTNIVNILLYTMDMMSTYMEDEIS